MNQEDFVQAPAQILLSPELEDLHLELVTGGDGLDRLILRPRVQKPGLAFAGYYEYIKPWRVQIIGESETKYLQGLPARLREKRVRDVAGLDVSCFIVTKGQPPLPELVHEAENRSVPLFATPTLTSQTITRLTYFLEESMAPHITMHAGLLDVYGIGVLLTGDSGIGKSECGLDLVSRGHRLIADDMVIIRRHPNEVLLGYASEILPHHMELRGIGIINIKDLFGVSSTRDIKPIDIIVKLEKWIEGTEYERLGVEGETYECLGVTKPLVRLPVASGRNLALLVEIAARNHLLKLQGHHSAERFADQLDEYLARKAEVGDEPRVLPQPNEATTASSQVRSLQSRQMMMHQKNREIDQARRRGRGK
ncbi:MAG: HPr(Ser) kinase/phosphatase [Thermoanaerobaculia bacterium]